MEKKKFYLTTPLYYVNDVPHIGHAYTTVAADVLARYKKMKGEEVFFLTGTDEHGQKVDDAAKLTGRSTQEYVDSIVERYKKAWKILNISYDDFIRTTEPRHVKVVQEIFEKLRKSGDIYPGEYEGWYCRPCETYWAEFQLQEKAANPKDYKCLTCGRPVEKLKEKTYFFKQEKYQNRLLKHIKDNPDFIQPASRCNEIVSFINQGLKDLSITRTTFSWGVPVPGEPGHVIYVWFDALINYISALGYPNGEKFEKYWPADVHIMGKEIVRFHAITWPCMLMALGIELPRKIFGHGWWTVEGEKMSKSLGNVVDPLRLSNDYGVDAVRYFLMREVFFGDDGNFSIESFKNRFNADLANDLGNLVHRTLTMIEKYFAGVVPEFPKNMDRVPKQQQGQSTHITEVADATIGLIETPMKDLRFSDALESIWKLINVSNKYIETEAPWKIEKAGEKDRLREVIFNLVYAIRIVAVLIYPFMPATAESIVKQLGLQGPDKFSLGTNIANIKVAKGNPLFPRLEKK